MCRHLPTVVLLLACGCFTRIHAPPPANGESPEPTPPPSRLTVVVAVDGESIRSAVESELSNPLQRQSTGNVWYHLEYEVWRDSLSLRPVGASIEWQLPVSFWAKARGGPFSVSCGLGEPRPSVLVGFRTRLSIGNDWNLSSHTRTASRVWSRRCRISFLRIDITEEVDPIVAQAQRQAAARADVEIPRVPLRDAVERAWALMHAPIQLGDGWMLSINPERLSVGELQGDGRFIRATVSLASRPEVAQHTESMPVQPLPEPGEPPASSDFIVQVSADVQIPYIEQRLESMLIGMELSLPRSRRPIRIVGVTVRAAAMGIAIGLKVSGRVRGTLWLWGELRYDALRREVFVHNLQYTLETRQLIVRLLERMLRSGIERTVQTLARWEIGDELDTLAARVRERLAHVDLDAATLDVNLFELTLVGVYSSSTHIHVVGRMAGHAELNILPTTVAPAEIRTSAPIDPAEHQPCSVLCNNPDDPRHPTRCDTCPEGFLCTGTAREVGVCEAN